jgi:hypothetical protein
MKRIATAGGATRAIAEAAAYAKLATTDWVSDPGFPTHELCDPPEAVGYYEDNHFLAQVPISIQIGNNWSSTVDEALQYHVVYWG